MTITGENLSEERFFPRPLSKDFYLVFAWDSCVVPTKYKAWDSRNFKSFRYPTQKQKQKF
jgi:hypothetical protein